MSVTHEERHRRANPCPICGGFDGQKRGQGKRCSGYTSADGKWTICTQVSEGAHHAVPTAAGESWAHLLRDEPMTRVNGTFTVNGGLAEVRVVSAKPVNFTRELAKIEKQLLAVESRSEAARSADEYEADRDEYDALWAKLEALQTQKKQVEEPEKPATVGWLDVIELSAPLPPVPWICRQMYLAPGAVSAFSGFGYSGKTALAQLLLISVANGLDFLSIMRCEQGDVGHLDYEQGKRLSIERMQRVCRGLEIPPAEALRRFRYRPFPEHYIDDAKGREVIERSVDGLKICLIDSGRASMPGIEENDSKSRVHIDALSRISERTGVTWLMVLHDGKAGQFQRQGKERGRGSSAIFDSMQTMWGFEKKDDEDFCRATLRKDRLTGGESSFGFRFVDSPGPREAADSWVKIVHLEEEQMKTASTLDLRVYAVTQAAMSQPDLNKTKLASLVAGKTQLTYTAIDLAVERGKLSLVNGTYRAV